MLVLSGEFLAGKEAFKSTRSQRPEAKDGSGGKAIRSGPAGGDGDEAHCPSPPHPHVTHPHPSALILTSQQMLKHLSTFPLLSIPKVLEILLCSFKCLISLSSPNPEASNLSGDKCVRSQLWEQAQAKP